MGRKWTAVLARFGVLTGDGRLIPPGSLTSRDLPLPLLWQEVTDDGHGGSRVVGRIETIEFGPELVTATGTLLGDEGWRVVEQIEAGVIGPSVDLDEVDYVMNDEGTVLTITAGRIAGATLVAIPAFADVSITLDPLPVAPMGDRDEPAEDPEALWMYASAAPEQAPPAEWFARPDLDRLTPLTVTDTGRVFGHIAPWGTCHVGLPGCVTAPHSPSDYSYFHQSLQRLAEGGELPVGTLTVGGGHAAPGKSWAAAVEHYDNVGTAVARVRAGEDEHGIWVAGWVLPQATPEQVEAFRSSPVSGDWRQIRGQLELVAVCSVNSAGFPVPRARVSFAHDKGQRSLVASFGITPVTGVEQAELETEQAAVKATEATRARWAWLNATTEG